MQRKIWMPKTLIMQSGQWTSSASITWELVRNEKSQAPSQTHWIRIGILMWFPPTLKFKQHPSTFLWVIFVPQACITSHLVWKVCAYDFFPCQAGNSWKVEAEHCVWPWISHCIEHNDRKQQAWVSVLVLPFTGCHLWKDFQSFQKTHPKSDCWKAEDFCTPFIHRLRLQEEPPDEWKEEGDNQFRVDDDPGI